MATYYWVGGTGNWSDATNHWANVSNGSPNASYLPTINDNVVFDDNSNVGTGAFAVTVDGTSASPSLCADFTASGLDGAMTLTMGATAFLDCYGSMSIPATNFSVSGTTGAGIRFKATASGKTLTTNGVSLGNVAVTFDGVNGAWSLTGAYTSTSTITLTNGSFDTANNNITCTNLLSNNSNVRSLTLGSSTLTLSGTTPITLTTPTNLTFNSGTSSVVCSAASPTFAGGGLTFYNVNFSSTSAGTVTITGANTYNNLTVVSLATTQIKNINVGANQTVNGTLTLGAANTAIRRLFVRSDAVGTPRTITAAAVAALADVDFRDIVAAGASGTWSGTRLGDGLGNSNIAFAAGKTVYRVGAGNWSATQWSLLSGGTVDVNNFPLAQDDCVFDTGTVTGTHTIDAAWQIGGINCSTLSVAVTLSLNGPGSCIYKDVELNSNVTLAGSQFTTFNGRNNPQKITSAGKTFTNPLGIRAFGTSVELQDAFNSSSSLQLDNGRLNLNGYDATCLTFTQTTTSARGIDFGSNKINITGNNTTVISLATFTNFSYTGTPRFEATYSGSTGTRTFDIGRGGGATESNAISLYVTAGSDIVDLRNIGAQYFKNLDFTGFTGSTSVNQNLTIYGDLVYSSGMTVSSSTSAIQFSKSTGTQTFTTNGKTIDIPINKAGAGTLQFVDALTQGSTRAFTITNGTVQLKDGATSTVGVFTTSGTSQKFLQSTLAGTQATLSQASGTVNASYLTVKDINATGGATWNAYVTNNNVNVSNNTGWDFYLLTNSIYDSLRLRGYTGTVTDMLLQYYKSNGATSNSLQDAESEFLILKGFTSGSNTDKWYAYLRSLSFTGTVTDMLFNYWKDPA